MTADDRPRAAPDLIPSPIADGHQQARVEIGWYNRNYPGTATELTRINAATGSALSAGRLLLSYSGKMLTNRNTIASYNLEDEDLLVLSVRDPKKK